MVLKPVRSTAGSIFAALATAGLATGADGSSTGIKFYFPATPDGVMTGGGETGQMGCEKIDFLFVIDNSGLMDDEQANLVASFPNFISTIQNTLMAQDYHIMAVDTDAGGEPPHSRTPKQPFALATTPVRTSAGGISEMSCIRSVSGKRNRRIPAMADERYKRK